MGGNLPRPFVDAPHSCPYACASSQGGPALALAHVWRPLLLAKVLPGSSWLLSWAVRFRPGLGAPTPLSLSKTVVL